MSVQVKGSGTIGGLDEGLVVSGIVTSSTQINVGNNIKLGNAGVVTATSFVGSGANLTSLPSQLTLSNNADNRVITGGSGTNLNGEANFTYDGTNLRLGTQTAAIGGGNGIMVASSTGARIKLCDSDAGVTANDGFEIIAGNGGTGYINNKENQAIVISTNNTERMRVTHEGSVGIGTDNSTYELEVHDGTGAAALRMKDGANNVICDLIANSTGGLLRTTYNHPLVFHTNQAERFRVKTDGIKVTSANAHGSAIQMYNTDSSSNVWYVNGEGDSFCGNVYPRSDGNKDLGFHSGYKWRDVVLSGGIRFGSATSTDYLDDYEEGSFTATLSASGGGASFASGHIQTACLYVKVGALVHVQGYFSGTNVTGGGSGIVKVSGLPFVSNNTTYYTICITHNTMTSNTCAGAYIQYSNTYFFPIVTNGTTGSAFNVGNPRYMMFGGSYPVQM